MLSDSARPIPIVADARSRKIKQSSYHTDFTNLVGAIPGPAIVFIRYSPIHRFYYNLVSNPADLESAPAWLVHDLGPENRQLIELAPDRKPYLYIEQKKVLVPLTAAGEIESLGP